MISLIAAIAENCVIGVNGYLPWHLPEDLHHFRRLTRGHSVIMGHRTFSEIGKPLPDRQNIILSRDPAFAPSGCLVARSLPEAISLARSAEIFIAGGASVYAEALPLCDRLYITEIAAAFVGDTFFPPFDKTEFDRIEEERIAGTPPYRYVTYIRKKTEQTDGFPL